MGLESVTYISDLVATNPVGATDPKYQGDDHIRNIKSALLATFPNIDGAMTCTQAELNVLDGVTAGTVTASKGIVVDSNKDAGTFRNVTATSIFATTFDTNAAAAGVTLAGVTLAADGTDSNISIIITPKGTGGLVLTSGNITLAASATIDGRDPSTDGAKLDLIEDNATADQTGAEIKTAYEGEADTNAFTDALLSKLNAISAGAEVNPDLISQAEAEAGTATTERTFNALRVAQAIAALGTASVSVKLVNSTHNVASTGVQSLTGISFTPVCAIILAQNNSSGCIGVRDADYNHCLTFSVCGGVAHMGFNASYMVSLEYPCDSNFAYASGALTSDGMDLTWAKSGFPTGVVNFAVLFIG